MSSWRCFFFGVFPILFFWVEPSYSQSEYSRSFVHPERNANARAEATADRVEAIFSNADMLGDYFRQNKIDRRLAAYLEEIGATPTPHQVHVFYVQAIVNAQGRVTQLKDFQYLTHGRTTVDAIRESFTLEGAPGVQSRMYNLKTGTNLIGIYVSAHPEDNKFVIRGGPLTPAFYQEIREEGQALRVAREKERTEARRIEQKREELAAAYRRTHQEAINNLVADLRKSPLPPGPALSSSQPLSAYPPVVYPPPPQTGSALDRPITDTLLPPAAHPPVIFEQAPAPHVERHNLD